MDEIQVGSYFTIVNNLRIPTDRSWQGDILRCNAIDWPFYACEEMRGFRLKFKLDARLFEFKLLSPDYIKALMGPEAGEVKQQEEPV